MASVPPTAILLSPLASDCAGKFGGLHTFVFSFFIFFFCKSIHLLYVIGGCIWDKVDKRAWTHTFVSFTTVQRTWARDTSCCSPNRMFSSITNSYLSTLYSAAHTHTDKIRFSWGSTPSTLKKKQKKKTHPTGSTGQQIRAKDCGHCAVYAFLGRLLPLSVTLNFILMLCSRKHKQLKMWLFYFIWWKPSVNVPITTVPICFYYVVHLWKIPAELATSVMCGWLAGCFPEHTCIPDVLLKFPALDREWK